MYEELQRKARPKPPRCILADGIKGLFGIVSPSKLLYEQCRIDGAGEEVRRYLEENRKYLLYRRRLNNGKRFIGSTEGRSTRRGQKRGKRNARKLRRKRCAAFVF